MKSSVTTGGRLLLTSLLLYAGLSQAASSPDLALMGMRDALVQNDLKSLVHIAMAPDELERERSKLERRTLERHKLDQPESGMRAFQRKQFDEHYGMLLGPDAVSLVMNEVGPKLAELRVPMLAGQMQFFIEASKGLAEAEELSEQHRAELLALLGATQMYLARTDVLDPARFRKAVQDVVLAARAAGVYSLDQLEQLQFDERLIRFSHFLSAGKRALAHYDLDANAVLRSARFRTLDQSDNTATVEVELTVLDVRVHFPLNLYAHQGRWYFIPSSRDYGRRATAAREDQALEQDNEADLRDAAQASDEVTTAAHPTE